jgi:hypothetical protein
MHEVQEDIYMDILKPIKTSINIPIDDDLLDVLMTKINNLQAENEHLKYKIRKIQEEKACLFSIQKQPETIEHYALNPILRLACYCSIENHSHQKHVICKILGNDKYETRTLAYYSSENELVNAPLSVMLEVVAILHKNLIHELIRIYQNEMIKD